MKNLENNQASESDNEQNETQNEDSQEDMQNTSLMKLILLIHQKSASETPTSKVEEKASESQETVKAGLKKLNKNPISII